MDYKIKVDNETQLQMTTVYQRNGRKPRKQSKREKQAKHTFGVVVKGFMITSVLLSSLVSGGALKSLANDNSDQALDNLKPVAQQEVNAFQDEQAVLSNLKMAIKFLDAGIQQGQVTLGMYTKVLERIGQIDGILATGGFEDTTSLIDSVNLLDKVIKQDTDVELTGDILAKREATIQAVHDLQTKLGYTSKIEDSYNPIKDINENVQQVQTTQQSVLGTKTVTPAVSGVSEGINEAPATGVSSTEVLTNEQVPVQSTQTSNTIMGFEYYTLVSNGSKITTKGAALHKKGVTFVSLYQYNKALNGHLSGKNNLWTMKVGNNTIQFKVGSQTYKINGKSYHSKQGKVMAIGGNVYVTADMASNLNHNVTTNTTTKTVALESTVQKTETIELTVKGTKLANAVVKEGISYVPIRAVYETLGAKVTTEKVGYVTITKDGVKQEYKRESNQAVINGKEVTLKGKTITIGSNTLIDATSVQGVYNAKVEISNNGKTVTITEVVSQSASVTVNGKYLEGKKTSTTVQAPIRDVFEAMNYDVKSVGEYIIVTKGTDTLMFKKESNILSVNGKTYNLKEKTTVEKSAYQVDVLSLDGILGISVKQSNTGQAVTVTQTVETQVVAPKEEKPADPKPSEQVGTQTEAQMRANAEKILFQDGFMFVNQSPQKVGNIMTLYNGHTYGVKNQAEYDAVMKEATRLVEKSKAEFTQAQKEKFINESVYLWQTGFQYKDKNKNPLGYQIREYYESGMSYEDAVILYHANKIARGIKQNGSLSISQTDPRAKNVSNAYHHLIDKLSDCDAESQAMLIAYDMMGFSSAINGTQNIHVDLFVKYKGKTYNAIGGLTAQAVKTGASSVFLTQWTNQNNPFNLK